MKKMAEIMEELGFNPKGSDDVKKAFIKNLIKQAQKVEFTREFDKNESDLTEKDPLRAVENYKQISLFDQKKSS